MLVVASWTESDGSVLRSEGVGRAKVSKRVSRQTQRVGGLLTFLVERFCPIGVHKGTSFACRSRGLAEEDVQLGKGGRSVVESGSRRVDVLRVGGVEKVSAMKDGTQLRAYESNTRIGKA